MPSPEHLPLFPLDVVLLPSMQLPLHIFEPRYKVMIRRCLENAEEFGMVLARGNKVWPVGCTAHIVRKIRDYPDGRMDILTEGRRVFALHDLLTEKEYAEGTVSYLDDDRAEPSEEDRGRLAVLFHNCHRLLFGQAWTPPADTRGILSYHIAALLPVELEQKQELLEMRSERDRCARVIQHIEKLLPKLEAWSRARRTAGGNGHGPN
jgi:Lon protease-like protein